MRKLLAETGWSCLPTALAMIANLTFEEIIAAYGHDGSEICDPSLKVPYCYRGFDMAETTVVALCLGIALVQTEKIYARPAILLGEDATGVPHAVAWTGDCIYDPAGGRYSLDSFRIESCHHAFELSPTDRNSFCDKTERGRRAVRG